MIPHTPTTSPTPRRRRHARLFAKLSMLAIFQSILGCATAEPSPPPAAFEAAPYNRTILAAIAHMPKSGGYATNRAALNGLVESIQAEGATLRVRPQAATPSFCSSGTYLLFVKTLEQLATNGHINMSAEAAERLKVARQADGIGMWGRWNANGPGTARLFSETGLGINFESYELAKPGDFMKIFWTDEIGSREFGHLVVYQGSSTRDGQEMIRFWSSNQPDGYGSKEVPKEKIKWAVFSRLTAPQRIDRLPAPRDRDDFLADMLKRPFTRDEVRKATHIIDAPKSESGVATLEPITPIESAPILTEFQTHRVSAGETLAAIAQRYQTTVEVLARENSIDDVHRIQAGADLRVPIPKD